MNKKDEKKISEFVAKHRLKDLIGVLEELRDKKDSVFKHFYWGRDPFWGAFVEHLTKNRLKILEPPTNSEGQRCAQLIGSSSSGPIHFRDAYAMSPGCFVRERKDGIIDGKIDWSLAFFTLQIDVDWYDSSAAPYEDHPCITKKYSFSVPYDLFRKFTKKKFDLWIKKQSSEFLAGRKEEASKTLAAIRSEFPELLK